MCQKFDLTEADRELLDQVLAARADLADRLTDLDDTLADTVIGLDSIDHLKPKDFYNSIRKVTLMQVNVLIENMFNLVKLNIN